MNTSLLAVQIPSDSTGSTPGAAGNSSGKQQDSAFPGGFGPVLDQASTALATDADSSAPLPEDMQDLASQLQSLPQGGKLLPLLQQVLDSAAAGGADRQQLIDSISARLEQLKGEGDTDPVAALAATLNQMLAPQPGQALTAEAATLVNAQGRSGRAAGEAGDSAAAARLTQQSVPEAAGHGRPLPGDTLADSKSSLFDRSLMELQQQTPEPRQSELSTLLAAFKRQLDNPGKPVDSLPRPEVLSATGSAAVSSSPTAVPPPGQTTLNLATPLNQAGWDQALGERVQWLAGQNIQGARITLNPANLGPMEVRIQMQNDHQASIQFTSAHGVVREALEAAMPRLRDMFEASGVELVDVDVTGQSFAGQQRGTDEESIAGRAGADGGQLPAVAGEPELELISETPLTSFLTPGRLDLFA
ncbi:MAG TPA: hypothetical protein ENJ80_10755 [Gammaproteobacteria bacterium]|nr:hypothetical protein [Gammaproteobacteria bacterium]